MIRLAILARCVGFGACAALAACSPASDSTNSEPAGTETGSAKPAAVAPGMVRLGGEGLTVTGPMGTTLAFGSPRTAAEQELARALGPATDRTSLAECGAGPMDFTSYVSGLTLNFQDDRLVGWTLRREETEGPVRTDAEIAVGSSEADAIKAYAIEPVEGSTLGDEFTSAAGIGGFLSGNGGDTVVESLHAGTVCFFR